MPPQRFSTTEADLVLGRSVAGFRKPDWRLLLARPVRKDRQNPTTLPMIKTRRKDAIRKNLERTIIRLAEAEHQLLSAASAASASRSRMARISAATSK